jgi:hypothetical protein
VEPSRRARRAGSVLDMARIVPPAAHEVRVVDGRFCHAVCSCGWRGAGRRTRATARAEAHDHALLYADGRDASAALPELPRPARRTSAEV